MQLIKPSDVVLMGKFHCLVDVQVLICPYALWEGKIIITERRVDKMKH